MTVFDHTNTNSWSLPDKPAVTEYLCQRDVCHPLNMPLGDERAVILSSLSESMVAATGLKRPTAHSAILPQGNVLYSTESQPFF